MKRHLIVAAVGLAAAITLSCGLAACKAGQIADRDWTVQKVYCRAAENGYEGSEQEFRSLLAANEIVDLGTSMGEADHEHIFPEWTVILTAACNSIGLSFRQCTLCREAEWKFEEALPHSFGEKRVIKEPTCEEAGVALYTCTECGTVKEEELAKGDHVFDTAWSYDIEGHFHAATCGHAAESGRAAHSFEGGVCTVCGMPSGTYLVPVAYTSISMYFGENITPWEYLHNGVDFVAEAGTPVFATAAGVVTNLGGDMLIIAHANGVESWYRCIDIDPALKEGDTVLQGQKIGTIAKAPNYEGSEAHLCFELTFDKMPKDPLPYLGIDPGIQFPAD